MERSIHLISLIVIIAAHCSTSNHLLSNFGAVSLGKIIGYDRLKVHFTFIAKSGRVFGARFDEILRFISCESILSSLKMAHV